MQPSTFIEAEFDSEPLKIKIMLYHQLGGIRRKTLTQKNVL